jgi:hypothetical protein
VRQKKRATIATMLVMNPEVLRDPALLRSVNLIGEHSRASAPQTP